MTLPTLGTLQVRTLDERPDLLGVPVREALASWPHAGGVGVAEIDPELADTAACSEAYDVPLEAGANCVVVSGRRDGEERVAACLVRADTRADVNNLVKRLLDVRKCSFHALDRAVEESGMEYGGITPIGLPSSLAAAPRRPRRGPRRGPDRLRGASLQAVGARSAAGAAAGRRGHRGPRPLSQVVAHRSRGSHRRPASSSHRPRTVVT